MSQGESDQAPLRNWSCCAGSAFVLLAVVVLMFPAGYAVWYLIRHGLW